MMPVLIPQFAACHLPIMLSVYQRNRYDEDLS